MCPDSESELGTLKMTFPLFITKTFPNGTGSPAFLVRESCSIKLLKSVAFVESIGRVLGNYIINGSESDILEVKSPPIRRSFTF